MRNETGMLKELHRLLEDQGSKFKFDEDYWREPVGAPKHRKSARIREIAKNTKDNIIERKTSKTETETLSSKDVKTELEREEELFEIKNVREDEDCIFHKSLGDRLPLEVILESLPPAIRAEVADFKPLGSKKRMQSIIEMTCWEAANNIDDEDDDDVLTLDDLEDFNENKGMFWGRFNDHVKIEVDNLIKCKDPLETFKAEPKEHAVPLNEMKCIDEVTFEDEEYEDGDIEITEILGNTQSQISMDDEEDDDIEILEVHDISKPGIIDGYSIQEDQQFEMSEPDFRIISLKSICEDVSSSLDETMTCQKTEAAEETLLCASGDELMMDDEKKPCINPEIQLRPTMTSWFTQSPPLKGFVRVLPSNMATRKGNWKTMSSPFEGGPKIQPVKVIVSSFSDLSTAKLKRTPLTRMVPAVGITSPKRMVPAVGIRPLLQSN